MVLDLPLRAHVITGGFPLGQPAGHDHDYARLRLLEILEEKGLPASVGNEFSDIGTWLQRSKLLITYVAGPYANDEQSALLRNWISEGGRWLALHGTSGGRAARVPGERQRVMVKTSHHETLGSFFINHPPVRRYRIDVGDRHNPLLKDLPDSFETTDELYMIEVLDPAASEVLLTTELAVDPSPPGFGFAYEKDTSLQADGKTRVLGYTRKLGAGAVTYIGPGHCHTPTTNSQPFVDRNVTPDGTTPPVLRATWESEAYRQLLRNAVSWGIE